MCLEKLNYKLHQSKLRELNVNGRRQHFAVTLAIFTSLLTICFAALSTPNVVANSEEDNHIIDGLGDIQWMFQTEGDVNNYINRLNSMGYKWAHLSLDFFDWEDAESKRQYSRYYINPICDLAITRIANQGVKIVYCLNFWDEEIQPQQGYARFKNEDEIQRYLNFTRFIVHNLKDRIQYYEILNEPRWVGYNTPFHQQNIEVNDYINLVNRTVQVIRQEYQEAKIVVGAVVLMYSHDYLFSILESNIMPLVDVVSWHPFYGTSPQYAATRDYYYNYPSIVQDIKDVASAHGFKGEYLCEEMNWKVNPPTAHPYAFTSETVCAKYYGRGIVMNLGMNVTAGVGAMSHLLDVPKMVLARNLCNIMAGIKPLNLPIQIQSPPTAKIRYYCFSSTSGDRLIALWSDEAAVDENLVINANLSIPDFAGKYVIGIDILNNLQQPIITNNENSNLVIKNLGVTDYPLILRIQETAPTPIPTPTITPTTPSPTHESTPTSTPTASPTATPPTPTPSPSVAEFPNWSVLILLVLAAIFLVYLKKTGRTHLYDEVNPSTGPSETG
jgi:hypothetical protein